MSTPASGSALRGVQRMLHLALVGLAASIAALLSHVVIDVAGDYLLKRDAYDGIAHGSRGIFVIAIAALTLAVAARLICDLLDRRCGSAASLLRLVRCSLGKPLAFIAQTLVAAVVTLIAMEMFDCLAAHVTVNRAADLLGGSLPLGLSAVFVAASLTGWLVHRVVAVVSEREPEIRNLICYLMTLTLCAPESARVTKRPAAAHSIARALLLSARGSKRGPPLPIPV